jgi:Flp pilus assembly protein TadG
MRRPPSPLGANLARAVRRLGRDESGNVIVYVTLTAALLLGMVGLALDSSRALITHSEAQAAADAAALAGASQLDGQAGACGRAKAEATAVANQKRFATGSNTPTTGVANIAFATANMRCLTTLPASDSTVIANGADASDLTAHYIQVTTEQLTHNNSLLDVLTTQNTATIQRKAVAGFRRSLCAAAPVMMACDTLAWTPGVAFDAWSAYGDNKGFVSNCGPNAPCIKDTLASTQPSFCLSDSTSLPQPGNKTNKAQDGINTRFGIGSSNPDEPSDRDIADFTPYSSESSGAKAQGANWNCDQYFKDFHSSDGLARPASCGTKETTTSRYSVYQSERAQNKIPAPGPSGLTTSAERRFLYLAIFNCNAGATIPAAFLKTFMIGPAKGTSTKTIYVEALGIVTSKTDPTVLHEEVQLYR